MVLFVSLVLVVGLILAIDLWRCPALFRWLYHSSKLPGPLRLPIIGSAHIFLFKTLQDKFNIYINLVQTYGNVYRLWMGDQLLIVCSHPVEIEAIFTSKKCINKGRTYRILRDFLNEGLLTSADQKWHARRKILTPAFHFKILEQFVGVFDKHGEILVGKLKEFSPDDKVDLNKFVTMFALDAICETSMGTCVNAQDNDQFPYVKALKKISHMLVERTFSVLYQEDAIFDNSPIKKDLLQQLSIVHGFTESVIAKRRLHLREQHQNKQNIDDDLIDDVGSKRKISFLDILLSSQIDGQPLSDLDVREEVDTFMFEGHDTVSSAMLFALFNIARYADVQHKCVEEINDVFVDRGQPVTMSMLNRLPYMDLVIKETERMYPSVAGISRTVSEDLTINGQLFPAGCEVAVNIFCLGRNPDVHEEPDTFRPERFDTTTTYNEKGKAFASVPFSAGFRNCIGQKSAELEMKSVLVKLLQNFEFSLCPESAGDPELMTGFVLEPAKTLYFRVKRRAIM